MVTSVDTIVQEYLQMKALLSYFGDQLLPVKNTDSNFQTKNELADKSKICAVRKKYEDVNNDGNKKKNLNQIRNFGEIIKVNEVMSKAANVCLDTDMGNKILNQSLSKLILGQAENVCTFQKNRTATSLVSTDSYSEVAKQAVTIWTPDRGKNVLSIMD